MSYRIYLIVHVQSGRVYFGQTSFEVEYRLHQHFRLANRHLRTHLANAVRAYGVDAFVAYELAALSSKEEADALEMALIREQDATDPVCGFNITIGGEGHRKARCVHGHDTRVPGGRTRSGQCASCERARCARLKEERLKNKQPPRKRQPERFCRRGHDKWKTGKFKNGTCVVCNLEYEMRRRPPSARRALKGYCTHGHEIAVEGRTSWGHCIACRRTYERTRTRRQKAA